MFKDTQSWPVRLPHSTWPMRIPEQGLCKGAGRYFRDSTTESFPEHIVRTRASRNTLSRPTPVLAPLLKQFTRRQNRTFREITGRFQTTPEMQDFPCTQQNQVKLYQMVKLSRNLYNSSLSSVFFAYFIKCRKGSSANIGINTN